MPKSALSEAINGVAINLMALFGRDVSPAIPRDKNSVSSFGDVTGVSAMSNKSAQLYPAMPRQDLIRVLREMDSTGLAASVVDMQSEDATANEDGEPVVSVEGRPQVRELIKRQHVRLDMCNRSASDVRSMCFAGSHTPRLVYASGKGVTHLLKTEPEEVTIEVDPLLQEIQGYRQTGRKFRDGKSEVSWPYDYIHFKLNGRTTWEPYGESVLARGIRTWTQMTMAEDMALTYRITRAPDRFVYKIDIGTSSEAEGWKRVQEFKSRMRRKAIVDPTTQRIRQEYSPVGMIEDIFLGVRPESQTSVDTLQGSSNVDSIQDLVYYARKFLAECRCPAVMLGFDDPAGLATSFSRNKRLSSQDVRYARHIQRIQRAYCSGLTMLAKIECHLHEDSLDEVRYDYMADEQGRNGLKISLPPPSFLAELERMEVMQLRMQLANDMLNLTGNPCIKPYEWTLYVLKHVMRLPSDKISKLTQRPKGDGDGDDGDDGGGGGGGQFPAFRKGGAPKHASPLDAGKPKAQKNLPDKPFDNTKGGDIKDSEREDLASLVESSPELAERLDRLALLWSHHDDENNN